MAKQHDGPRRITLLGAMAGGRFLGQTSDGQTVIASLNGTADAAGKVLAAAQRAGLSVVATVDQGDLTTTS